MAISKWLGKGSSKAVLVLCFFFLHQTAFSQGLREKYPYLIKLRDINPSITQELRYATSDNFTGTIVPGYRDQECYLDPKAAIAINNVEKLLNKSGISLVMFDCFRPQEAVDYFTAWVEKDEIPDINPQFNPRISRKMLFEKGYIGKKSSHMTGLSVDVGLRKISQSNLNSNDQEACNNTGTQEEWGRYLNMGTKFDCFDEKSHIGSNDIPLIAKNNRKILMEAMEKNGFKAYRREWWHFTLK